MSETYPRLGYRPKGNTVAQGARKRTGLKHAWVLEHKNKYGFSLHLSSLHLFSSLLYRGKAALSWPGSAVAPHPHSPQLQRQVLPLTPGLTVWEEESVKVNLVTIQVRGSSVGKSQTTAIWLGSWFSGEYAGQVEWTNDLYTPSNIYLPLLKFPTLVNKASTLAGRHKSQNPSMACWLLFLSSFKATPCSLNFTSQVSCRVTAIFLV